MDWRQIEAIIVQHFFKNHEGPKPINCGCGDWFVAGSEEIDLTALAREIADELSQTN